ncbi:MAG: hypothetical protein KDK36_08610 [Leptospiraceae bacterium]|nr:hypothetical protein [Leptospiraceae bacterium]
MSKKTVNIDEEVHVKAKILSAKTGKTIGEIIELLINGTTEKEILKLAEKKK